MNDPGSPTAPYRDPRSPLVVEIDYHGDWAFAVFIEWAGREATRLMYTPDVLLAVDTPDRRGYMIDEIYWITAWVSRGADEFLSALQAAATEHPECRIRINESEEPNPDELLAGALEHGQPLDRPRRPRTPRPTRRR